jgi:hypothetical protein
MSVQTYFSSGITYYTTKVISQTIVSYYVNITRTAAHEYELGLALHIFYQTLRLSWGL